MEVIKRWGGLGAVIGGLGWSLFHFWYIQSRLVLPDDVAQLYGIPATGVGLATILLSVAALSLAFKLQRRSFAFKGSAIVITIGLILIAVAVLLLGLLQIGASWLLGIAGELIIIVGLIWLGLSNFGRKGANGFSILALVMAPIYFYNVTIMNPSSPYAAEWAGLVYGLLWIPFGFFIWRYSDLKLE